MTTSLGTLLPHLAGRRKALQMRLRPHPGGVRSKAEGADPADERGAASPAGPGTGQHPAGQAHQDTEEDLEVHEIPPRCDQLPSHRQRRRGDESYGGKMV